MKRRVFLISAGALALGTMGRARADAMHDAMQAVLDGASPREGRVSLDLPPLVENGNTVPFTVKVESPMSAQDHVRAIHVFNEKNPQPNIASFQLGPRAGRAVVSTRIRLADSQTVVALAQMSDGSWWSGSARVIVTVAACTETV
jgi:sulfur-oxidizing protein SoxY